MSKDEYSVVLFLSVSHALKAERLLKKEEIPNKLIPVPRHISSECGVCLRIAAEKVTPVRALLTGTVPFEAIEPLADGKHS